MIIRSGDLQFVLEGGTRWTFVLKNLRPDTPNRRAPDTRISVFRREVDGPPTASFTIDANENDGTVTITDTSTDAVGVASIEIDWGDGTVDSGLTPGGTYMHTYATTDTYTIELTATDTSGQTDTASQSVSVTVLWTPAELAPDLVVWRGVDDVSTLTLRDDGGIDRVEAFADRSGNGHDMTQGTAVAQPVWTGTTIRFDGVDDVFVNTSAAATQPYTSMVVAENSDALFNALERGPSGDGIIIRDDGAEYLTFAGTILSGGAADDGLYCGLAVANGVNSVLRAQGEQVATGDAGTGDLLGDQSGANKINNSFSAGDLYAIVHVDGIVADADIERLEGWAAGQFGIPLVPGHPYENSPPTL